MIITGVRKTKRGNLAIDLDGVFFASVSPETWMTSQLSKGDVVDDELLNELLAQNRAQEAKRRAINMLSARSYTTRQLTDRIAKKTGREAAVVAAERMEELGLLDDADYAARFARELFENRRYAPRRIRLELHKRGLSAELCEQAMQELDLDCLPQRATELVEARFGTLSTPAEARRASALLERYGYPSSIARGVLRALEHFETLESETEDYL